MPKVSEIPATTVENNNWFGLDGLVAQWPLIVGLIIGVIVLYALYSWLTNRNKGEMKDYNKEAYKAIETELNARRLNRGMAESIVSMCFGSLGFIFGAAVVLLVGLNDIFWLAMTAITCGLIGYLSSLYITANKGHWFIAERYIWSKNMSKLGTLYSDGYLRGNGLMYYLIKRGTKWGFFSNFGILVLPYKYKMDFVIGSKKVKDDKGNVTIEPKTVSFEIDKLDELVFKNPDGHIIVNCVDFEELNRFHFPVIEIQNKGKQDGKTVAVKDYFSFKDVAFMASKQDSDYLAMIDLSVEQQRNIIVAVASNPFVRFAGKLKDKHLELEHKGNDDGIQ